METNDNFSIPDSELLNVNGGINTDQVIRVSLRCEPLAIWDYTTNAPACADPDNRGKKNECRGCYAYPQTVVLGKE